MSSDQDTPLPPDSVAVIGMAGRFPGAADLEQFWRNLRDGVESIVEVTAEEALAAGVPAATCASPDHVKRAAVLDGVDLFDAAFFGIAAREAALMDPQQRLFLECAWEALEAAGHEPRRFAGKIGVYAGASLNTYAPTYIYSDLELMRTADPLQTVVAIDKDFLATLVSYKLDLRGPSLSVQTACSTALVGVHLACQSLATYQCDMALAGGVCVKVPQRTGYLHAPGGVVARDGRCRAFDAGASGTLFGSGLGIVVLRRLEDALADGDAIAAVIRGSAINNDGAVKVGFTAPSVRGQAEVIALAQALAGVRSRSITYVEAHGTGTPLGDPIEIAALREAFGAAAGERGFCAIGSVKTNVGHLDAAAGIAGLIKTALALSHREIPPSLHFERPNPEIDFAASPFFVNDRLRAWPADRGPRRAGVSSFGIGGTNAHLVLEEGPPAPPAAGAEARGWHLVPLAARSASALAAMAARLAGHLDRHPEAALADVAYTLQTGRRAFDHRLVLVCQERVEAAAALADPELRRCLVDVCPPGEPPVAFLLSGQGAQYAGMGSGLYASEPVYRREVDRCAELLRPHLGRDLRGLLDAADRDSLTPTALAQPALFVVEYALARLWMEWGVRPTALLGHSIGEYVAACLAGTLELADALELVAARGRLMQQLPPGAMLSVPLGEDDLAPWLGGAEGDLSLAAVNAPALCVVSGPAAAVDTLRQRLAAAGIEGRLLHTSHAFHSAMVEPILEPFAAAVAKVRLQPPRIPFVSNLTGTWITAAEATDPRYWVRHLRQPVRFLAGVGELLAEPRRVLLEVGPGRTLAGFAQAHPRCSAPVVACLRHPADGQADAAFLATALGRLWLAGVPVDWAAYHAGRRPRRLALPTYPFERQRFWLGQEAAGEGRRTASTPRAAGPAEWFHLPIWKQSMAPAAPAADLAAPAWWLLLGDGAGMAAALAGELAARGVRVTTVGAGAGFARRGADSYAVDLLSRDDYAALLRDLAAAGAGLPQRLVHLGALTAGTAAADPLLSGFHGLLALAQALGESALAAPLAIDVVADGLWRIGAEDAIEPAKATLLGPVLVMPQEYPHLRCRIVDVGAPAPAGLGPAARRLLAELQTAAAEDRVALRGHQRWVQALEPLRLAGGAPARLRERGVYLVTGGFGGLGLALAGHLARQVRARLVLVGRRGLPPRDGWDGWLREHGETDAVSRGIRGVQELEAAGGEVLAIAADVCDPAAVREVVAAAHRRFGALHGVIHAAGVAGGGAIQLKTREAAAAVLAPKVQGTLALAAATAELPLDFIALFSSTLALTGAAGQVDYCAANAFLDAFAQAAAGGAGPPVLAIDWDAWSEVGMAAAAAPAPGAGPGPLPAGEESGHPLLGRRLAAPAGTQVHAILLGAGDHWTLREHAIAGLSVLPGTALLEMARAAAERAGFAGALALCDVVFLAPLAVPAGEPREIQTVVRATPGGASFEIRSRAGGDWHQHASGRVEPVTALPARHEVSGLAAGLAAGLAGSTAVELGRDGTVAWGAHWREVVCRPLAPGVASLELPAALAEELAALPLHPALLDLAMALGVADVASGEGAPYLPFAYRRLTVFAPLPPRIYVRAMRRPAGSGDASGTASCDVAILDADGREVVVAEELVLRRLAAPPAPAAALAPAAAPAHAAPPPAAATAGIATTGIATAGIATADGVAAFVRALDGVSFPQVVITPRVPRPAGRTDASAAAAAPAPRPTRRPSQTPYAAPHDEVEQRLAELWAAALGYEPVGVHDDFFAQGGHSVIAIQLLSRLRQEFAIDVPLTALFGAPTVAQLAALVRQTLGDQAAAPETAAASLPVLVAAPAERHQPFPLTDIQQAYWIGRRGLFDLGNVAAHSYNEWPLSDLDLGRLAAALDRLVERHEMLRAVISADGQQRILAVVPPYEIRVEDLRGEPAARVASRLAVLRDELSHQVLPAERWPLFDLRVSRLDERQARIHLSFDILIGDLWSFRLLLAELRQLYRDPAAALPPVEMSFRDYVVAQRAFEVSPHHRRAEEHWRGLMRDLPGAPDLPLARGAGAAGPTRFERRAGDLDPETWRRLQDAAAARGLTPSGLLAAAYAVVLALWSKGPRFALSVTTFNRLPIHPHVGRVIGDFTSLTLLAVDLSGEMPFAARARQLQEQLWANLQHGQVSAVRVMRELARAEGRAPGAMFPVVFTSLIMDDPGGEDAAAAAAPDDPAAAGLDREAASAYSISQTPQVWLDHQVGTDRGRLVFNWDSIAGLFPAGMLDEMFLAYRRLLAALAAETAWDAGRFTWLFAESLGGRQAANATAAPVSPLLLHEPFVERAARRPELPAVVAADRTLTYGELDRLSNRIAQRLRRLGARPNRLVAVVMEKGWQQVAAVLGILKSGAAYLPIDAALPAARRRHLLERGAATLALTQPWLDAALDWPDSVVRVAVGDDLDDSPAPLPAAQRPNDLAYVIFTSGSTGQPKGVMIDHRSALNTVLDVNQRFAVGEADRVLALSSLSFDLSVYDLFGTLAAGGAVVVPEAAARRDPASWLELVGRHRVTVWNSVPMLLGVLVEYAEGRPEAAAALATLRLALLSGDWLPVPLPDRLRALAAAARVVSLGGATEAAIWSISYPIGDVDPLWTSIPYGRPLRSQTFHVLDGKLEPRPTWVPGELYIGGVGLAQGYWRDEVRTAESFLTHPASGERLYRTGDLGRYLPDGDIEFLGREDAQVKVGGHRIELGEIEAALAQHPAVRACVVTAVGPARGPLHLVAHVAAAAGAPPEGGLEAALRADLASRLPDYMVPAAFSLVEALPLTANGKVDRQALAAAAAAPAAAPAPDEEPRTPMERQIAALWCALLGRERVAIHVPFFSLGGDSIQAVQFLAHARQAGIELTAREFFEHPTVAGMAALARALAPDADAAEPPADAMQAADAAEIDVSRADLSPQALAELLGELANEGIYGDAG